MTWQQAKLIASEHVAAVNLPDNLKGWTAQIADATAGDERLVAQWCKRLLKKRGAKVFYIKPTGEQQDGPILSVTAATAK